MRRAMRVAQRLRAGSVWVNAYRVVSPAMPFGGFGACGIGRENGSAVLHEYTETRVDLDRDARRDPGPLHARVGLRGLAARYSPALRRSAERSLRASRATMRVSPSPARASRARSRCRRPRSPLRGG